MPNFLEMIRLYELSYSLRKISQVVGSSHQIVTKTVRLAQAKHLTYQELQKWPLQDLEELFGSSSTTRTRVSDYQMPDFEKLAKELVRPGVTMQLLWEEYVDRCQMSGKTYYRLTQFKKHFNDYLSQTTYSQKLSHKAAVENTVKQLTTHLIARMRNYQCFNIDEYNHYLLKELNQFNQRPFQKKDGSIYILFKEMEQPLLQPLPKFSYEICTYREAKVYDNSHISLNKRYYSVPYQYIGQSVQLKIYQERLEIYYNQQLICQHSTKYKSTGVYTTDPQHLPRDTQYHRWNKERYINWAKRIGPNVDIVITRYFDQGPEQHYYRKVHSILKMADIYSDQRLDKACHYALEQASHPTYAQIKSLLDSRLFQNDDNMTHNENEQAYLRGADYYEQFSSKD